MSRQRARPQSMSHRVISNKFLIFFMLTSNNWVRTILDYKKARNFLIRHSHLYFSVPKYFLFSLRIESWKTKIECQVWSVEIILVRTTRNGRRSSWITKMFGWLSWSTILHSENYLTTLNGCTRNENTKQLSLLYITTKLKLMNSKINWK